MFCLRFEVVKTACDLDIWYSGGHKVLFHLNVFLRFCTGNVSSLRYEIFCTHLSVCLLCPCTIEFSIFEPFPKAEEYEEHEGDKALMSGTVHETFNISHKMSDRSYCRHWVLYKGNVSIILPLCQIIALPACKCTKTC